MEKQLPFWRGMTWVLSAYFTALLAGAVVGRAVPVDSPLVTALIADVVATVIVFAFSVRFRNASFYDAYWSVAPMAIVGYWTIWLEAGDPVRNALLLGCVAFWGTRLTTNWSVGWSGLDHEDWRYTSLREQTGTMYPLVNLFGIHLFPTFMVFAALYPAWLAATTATPWGPLELLGPVICVAATVLEALADAQLRRFKARGLDPSVPMHEGLWRWSRHPNYLGEIGFWFGLWVFAVTADPRHAVSVVGVILMGLMFRFISIPMMEKRMLTKRPLYADVIARTSMLLPLPPRGPRVGAPPPSEVDAFVEPDDTSFDIHTARPSVPLDDLPVTSGVRLPEGPDGDRR